MAKTVSHTPGPWKADYSEMGGYDCMTDAWSIKSSGMFIVAAVDLSSYGQTAKEDATIAGRSLAEADARLIAAAPELLAALKAMVASYDGLRDVLTSGIVKDKLAAADKAIAKAEGRE